MINNIIIKNNESYVPEGWNVVNLQDVILQAKTGFASGKRDLNGITQLRMNNISQNGTIVLNALLKVPIPTNVDEYILKTNDILFNNTNSVDLVGKSTIYMGELDRVTYSNHITRIRVDETKITPHWLLYQLIKKWNQGYFRLLCVRHVGQAGIRNEDLLSLKLLLPSLKEQRKITEILSTIVKAIKKSHDIISNIKLLKLEIMRQLLTKGLNHNQFIETEIGKIPFEWATKKISDLFNVKNGTTPPKKQKRYWLNGDINWLTPSDMSKLKEMLYIGISETKITEKALSETNVTLMPKGSILLSTRAPVGYVAILDSPATFNQGCKGLIATENSLIPEFYLYYLTLKRSYLQNLSSGSTFIELSTYDLANLIIPFPPLQEQQKIVEILLTIDERLKFELHRNEKLVSLKKTIMNDLLNGMKSIPNKSLI